MKPESASRTLLSITNSKAKMYEFSVPEKAHIQLPDDPARLFSLTIGLLGDYAAALSNDKQERLFSLHPSISFAAHFFDAYLNSKLDTDIDQYLLLLGSASYYLCNLPGSSLVLARLLDAQLELESFGLERLLLWLLQANFSLPLTGVSGLYRNGIDGIASYMNAYFNIGGEENDLNQKVISLREQAYNFGDARHLLLADLITAVSKTRYKNSSRFSLPKYSSIPLESWLPALGKETFIKELWPSQHLIGEHGVYRGRSAVIQMPTSAGKTKAIDIIIRSSILSKRNSLTVIVAPYRALCYEIRSSLYESFRNESVYIDALTDVIQADFELERMLGRTQILVVTPEKLVYVLRHDLSIAEKISLLIFDEGHQFDSGSRGVTFELLLASLKNLVPRETQIVLISAVITNAQAVSGWLLGEDSVVKANSDLLPTIRTLAFTSWRDTLGKLEFVSFKNPERQEFFVPRIVEQQLLNPKPRERKERLFPDREDGNSIALYLALRVIKNGSTAIFCGRKPSVARICEIAVDSFERGINLAMPIAYSNKAEIQRLHNLFKKNMGENAITTRAARLGVLAHHGNLPHGIRLAVEFSMRNDLAKLVICTSTLAQGVNLPLRYLVVASVYQGRNRMMVRDFQNLIGRAGRAGMYTEGSVIFADPKIFDEKQSNSLRWNEVKELLDLQNSEPCGSKLLTIFDPLFSDDGRYSLGLDPFELVETYLQGDMGISDLVSRIAAGLGDKNFTIPGLEEQIRQKTDIISAIESYLMAYWDELELGEDNQKVSELAKGTFAFSLADDEKKEKILRLFFSLAQNITEKIADPAKRKLFAKTLFGVRVSLYIESWVKNNLSQISAAETKRDLIRVVWPLLLEIISNRSFKKCDNPEILLDLANRWVEGVSYKDLFDLVELSGARLNAGSSKRTINIDHVVDICENGFAFEGSLIL